MKKQTLTLLILLTLVATALWFMGSWWYYKKLKCDCEANHQIAGSGTATDSTTGLTKNPANAKAALPVTTAESGTTAALPSGKAILDTDGDGISDAEETRIGTDPNNPDSDNDGIPDNEELGAELSMPIDSDKDNIIDALDTDDDNDGLPTLIEGKIGTSPLLTDTDGDTLGDAQEAGDVSDINHLKPLDSDSDGTINALDIDDDDDGLETATEIMLGTNPLLADSDGDGISDKKEIGDKIDQPADSDSDGIIDALDNQDNTDTDNDGVPDILEAILGTNPKLADSDGDGIDDIEEIGDDINQPLDTDQNGIINALDRDDDGDGLPTQFESRIGTNPLAQDSDNDGLSDREETGLNSNTINNNKTDHILDTDTDGTINPLDTDDDNDGLSTRIELSLKTNPLKADTDGDGIADAIEVGSDKENPLDSDADGQIDALDTDPKPVKSAQQKPGAATSETKTMGPDKKQPGVVKDISIDNVKDVAKDSVTQSAVTKNAIQQITAQIIATTDKALPPAMRLTFPASAQKTEMSAEMTDYFKQITNWLMENSKHMVTITGHTDNRGTATENLARGMRRVMEIRELLIDSGAPFQQLDVISRGEAEPIADNTSENGRRMNNRVDIVPLKGH